MAIITLGGNPVNTVGSLPAVGSKVPDFKLVKSDLSTLSNEDIKGKRVIFNIFPSLDTAVCAMSIRKFNDRATKLENTVVVDVSKDLPFAHKRFCSSEGFENVITGSDFKNGKFGQDFGVTMTDGLFQELHSRAVVVVDENGVVTYTEQVPEIAQEPDYEAALNALELTVTA